MSRSVSSTRAAAVRPSEADASSRPSCDFLSRVASGGTTASEVVTELRLLIPIYARVYRTHAWWTVRGEPLFEAIVALSQGRVYVSLRRALLEATIIRGNVTSNVTSYVVEGIRFFKVVPPEQVESALVEEVAAETLPPVTKQLRRVNRLPTLGRFREVADRAYLNRLLAKHRWNVTEAAEEAGICRQSMTKLLSQRGLQRPQVKEELAPAPSSPASPLWGVSHMSLAWAAVQRPQIRQS